MLLVNDRYIKRPTLKEFTFSREIEGVHTYKVSSNNYKKVIGKILASSEEKEYVSRYGR